MNTKKKRRDEMPYVERDVSWMYFNRRILQEAQKDSVPLLARLSFLGIYSNNLDEFFRVRVASLNRDLMRPGIDKKTQKTIKKTLKTINSLNAAYSVEYSAEVDHVFSLLSEKGILLAREEDLTKEQQDFLLTFFSEKLNGSVNPIWLDKIDDICALEDNRIYLAVERREAEGKGSVQYAIVPVPEKSFGRWIRLPSSDGKARIMYLDDVVRCCLPLIFCGMGEAAYRAYSFKFTKDAEMEIDNESDYGTVEKIKAGIASRKYGEAVRIEYDREMPEEILEKIRKRVDRKELDATLSSGRYQNRKDLMSFPDCGHADLRYPKWPGLVQPAFQSTRGLFEQIRKKDLFIHVPYHSFNGFIRLLREAAVRPDVKEIKTTLYRLARDSKVVNALITAARNGKKVTAVVELLARFDEESNIAWSRKMQDAGVNVVYGVEGLKIHSKLVLIETRKTRYACIGTGNFHEDNAKIYTDYLMMTARPRIVNEVVKVFRFISRPFTPVPFKELLVSPNYMKKKVLHLIGREIENARVGKEAWLKMKINHITDRDIVRKLYEASQAGVRIDILIRGCCSLVPGVRGWSENIRCVGIIDTYLEHSRILILCNGGSPRYYLGSADWMPRNLLSRIEVMTPVYDPDLQKDLLRTVEYGLKDTTNGRLVDGSGSGAMQAGAPFRSQEELYKAYKAEIAEQEKRP